MKILIRYIFILFVLGSGVAAHAQTTFTVADVTKVSETQWKYGTVTCTSQNPVTSIVLSMVNNQIASNSSGISPTRTITSLGNNPRTILYLFTSTLTSAQVEDFIKGATFEKTTEIPETNHTMNISVDANPTSLPGGGSTITAWAHPDGSMHYYVWVPIPPPSPPLPPASITWEAAYNAAKTYYFQGMRGYLPTITSKEENETLTNISDIPGWSGGVRTPDNIADQQTITRPSHSSTGRGANYRWSCGPETDFRYYQGPSYDSPGAGPMNNAFSGWNPTEPNNSLGVVGGFENCMQVNQVTTLYGLRWNDLNPLAEIVGYFIEFGGSGKAYSVTSNNGTDADPDNVTANYPANPNYNRPIVATTNDQWYGFAPGNEASTSTILKRGPLRVRTMILK